MPTFQSSLSLPVSAAELFLFLANPDNLPQLAPPDFQMKLVKGNGPIQRGSLLTWKGKRWGMSHQIIMEVSEWKENELLVWQQQKGPLKKWIHRQKFEKMESGTQLHEEIEMEPPGGMLGFHLTENRLITETEQMMAYRNQKLRERFGEKEEK